MRGIYVTLLVLFVSVWSGGMTDAMAAETRPNALEPSELSAKPAAERLAELAAPRELTFIGFDSPRAYPKLSYYTRMAVIGGVWPYAFELTKAPAGAQITKDRGEAIWTPQREGEVGEFAVKATDMAGKSVSKTWKVTVGKKGFYFVATAKKGGDDAKGDGSVEKPWASLQHALNKVSGPGTFYLREGLYREQSRPQGAKGGFDEFTLMVGTGGYDFGPQRKASREAPLHIASYPGEHAIIEPAAPGLKAACFWTPYVILEGLELRGSWTSGIWVGGYTIVRACDIHNIRGMSSNCQAIWVGGATDPELVVQDCHLHDVRQPPQPTHASGMTLYGLKDSLFEDNQIHDIDACGIDDKDGGRANTYRGNAIYDCDRIGFMTLGQSQHWDCAFHDNVIACKQGTAVQIGLHPDGVKRIRVHHNTALGPLNVWKAADSAVWNCIFQTDDKLAMLAGDQTPGFTASRCVFFAPGPQAFCWGDRYKTLAVDLETFMKQAGLKDLLFAKVEFADAAKMDFHLKDAKAMAQFAGPNDYMGAHERVLAWVADGCPMRWRDNVAARLENEAAKK